MVETCECLSGSLRYLEQRKDTWAEREEELVSNLLKLEDNGVSLMWTC